MYRVRKTLKGPLAALAILASPLPCLLAVALVVIGGAVGFAAVSGWFADNSLLLAVTVPSAVALIGAGGFMYARRRSAPACEAKKGHGEILARELEP